MKLKYRQIRGATFFYEIEADLCTPYQYKNKEDIYTGDVVKQRIECAMETKGYFEWYAAVAMEHGTFVLKQIGFDYTDKPLDEFSLLREESATIEKVGHIHDGVDYSKYNKAD